VVAPGYVTPWAAPGMPPRCALPVQPPCAGARLLAAGGARAALDAALAQRLRPRHLPGQPRALQRLAFYSRQRLHTLTEDLQLDYDRSTGYMVLLRSEKDRKLVQPGLQVLRDAGVKFQEIDADAARALEPALNPDTAFAGAIHLPDDEVGNCRQFAMLLKNQAQALGARFEFNASVAPLDPAQPTHAAHHHRRERRAAGPSLRPVVICGGLASATAAAGGPEGAAGGGARLLDQRADPRAAERAAQRPDGRALQGRHLAPGQPRARGRQRRDRRQPHTKRPSAIQTLYKVLHDWFPGAAQLANTGSACRNGRARAHAAGRPAAARRHRRAGRVDQHRPRLQRLGAACGSARAVADLMGGRPPEVDLEGLGVERLQA
jgi:D-amino-acid dehydrogenase